MKAYERQKERRENREIERDTERERVCVCGRERVGEQHNAGAQCAWRVIT